MKCCHPEWSVHPKRKPAFALLTEAMDTLRDETKCAAYVKRYVADAREREAALEAAADADAGGAPVDAAAELREQMAERTKRMLQQQRAAREKAGGARRPAAAGPSRPGPVGPARPPGAARPPRPAEEDAASLLIDSDDDDGGTAAAPARSAKPQKRRRVGMF